MHQIGRVKPHGSRKQPNWHLVEEREHQPTRRGYALRARSGRFPRCGSGSGKPVTELGFGKPSCKSCLKILARELKMDEPPIALVDLDGTVADYDLAMKESMEPLWAPDEERADLHSWHPPHVRARVNLVRSQPGWWRNLKPLKRGFEIIELLRKHKFRLMVLTQGPKTTNNSWTEKKEWCDEYLEDASVTISQDKGMVYGKLLFDDFPAYATKWLKHRPRGLVIMNEHPWNKDFKHPQVVKYSGNNINEVEQRILECLANTIGA